MPYPQWLHTEPIAATADAATEGHGSARRSSSGTSTGRSRRPDAAKRGPTARATAPTASSSARASSAFCPSSCSSLGLCNLAEWNDYLLFLPKDCSATGSLREN